MPTSNSCVQPQLCNYFLQVEEISLKKKPTWVAGPASPPLSCCTSAWAAKSHPNSHKWWHSLHFRLAQTTQNPWRVVWLIWGKAAKIPFQSGEVNKRKERKNLLANVGREHENETAFRAQHHAPSASFGSQDHIRNTKADKFVKATSVKATKCFNFFAEVLILWGDGKKNQGYQRNEAGDITMCWYATTKTGSLHLPTHLMIKEHISFM